MLVVNNSKNPAHDAKSLAKYSRVGEEVGSCCNHSKNPGEGEERGAMLCSIFDELPFGCCVADKRSNLSSRKRKDAKWILVATAGLHST